MTTQVKMPSLRTAVVALLVGLEAVAVYSMWVQMYRNGFFEAMTNLRHVEPDHLPCPYTNIHNKYTHIHMVDEAIVGLECAFGTIVDGSNPTLSLWAFRAAGNLFAICLLLWTESLKWEYRRGPLQIATPWLLLFNVFGLGIVMLIWCILHLVLTRSSKRLPSITSSSILELKCLPFSLGLGFILPTFLICLTYFSPEVHHSLLTTWQLFPFWILIVQYLTVYLISKLKASFQQTKKATTSLEQQRINGWHALRRTYITGIVLASICHVATLTLVISSELFPMLFSADAVQAFNWRTVFITPNFLKPMQVRSLSEGMLVFLQYDSYCGSLAAIIWATYLTHEVKRGKGGAGLTFEQMITIQNNRKVRSAVVTSGIQIGLILRTLAMVVLMGNGATILTLMFEKDRLVRGEASRVLTAQKKVRLLVKDRGVSNNLPKLDEETRKEL